MNLEEKNAAMVAERKDLLLKEIDNLELDNFNIPSGLPIPFRDELIILPVMQGETKTSSGIIIPSGSVTNPANTRKMGIVCRIGPMVTLPVKLGMKVYFDPTGRYFQLNAVDFNVYLLMLQHHILAAVTPDSYPVPEYYTREQERMIDRKEGYQNMIDDNARKLGEESDGHIEIQQGKVL
jgi:co-chaperonin GroES (HSP10)